MSTLARAFAVWKYCWIPLQLIIHLPAAMRNTDFFHRWLARKFISDQMILEVPFNLVFCSMTPGETWLILPASSLCFPQDHSLHLLDAELNNALGQIATSAASCKVS